MKTLDPGLEQFATPAQWEKLRAAEEHQSDRKAAKALGIVPSGIQAARRAVVAKAVKHGYSPEHDMLYPTPDGFRLKGTSTLYDDLGNKRLQWVKTDADARRQHEIFMEVVEALGSSIDRVPEISPPSQGNSDKFMSCYPVGDHHIGMLAWAVESGEDYDLKIAENLLMSATDHLVGGSWHASDALVVFLGDFMHYDSFVPVTPSSKNQLDADSRFPKMVRVAVRAMRYLIEAAAAKHDNVHVIIEIGNHDLSSSIFLMECMNNIYENNPRITIDTSPQHFHYHRFGSNLVATHHGHSVKLDKLPLIMATDRPTDWGETKHRYCWTGHVHHDQAKAYPGCYIESFSVLAPEDAYAAQKGYRSKRAMQNIVLHKDFGEVSRSIFNPDMLSGIT